MKFLFSLAACCLLACIGCGLNPPSNLVLSDGGATLSSLDAESCSGESGLEEKRAHVLKLPTGLGGDQTIGYAMFCGEGGSPQDGPFLGWREDGTLAVKGVYSQGKKSGQWSLLHRNGQRKASLTFQQGQLLELGAMFGADGRPDVKGTYELAMSIGSIEALETVLKRFPNETSSSVVARRLAALRFEQGGEYVTRRMPSNISGFVAYYHLNTTPKGKDCTMRGWDANAEEKCKKVYKKRCDATMSRFGMTTTCRVARPFYKALRGVAMRRAKCSSGDETCANRDDAGQVFVKGVKEGIWIDFNQEKGCAWGRYSGGQRAGIWLQWDTCTFIMNVKYDGSPETLSVGLNKKFFRERWWDEGMLFEQLVAHPPDKAFEYVNRTPQPIDVSDVLKIAVEIKRKNDTARVRKTLDACLKKPLVHYQQKTPSYWKTVNPNTFTPSDRASTLLAYHEVGNCISRFARHDADFASDYLSELCTSGNERACAEPEWWNYQSHRKGTIFRDPAVRKRFAKSLLNLCATDSQLTKPACVQSLKDVKVIFSEAFKGVEGKLKNLKARCKKRWSVSCNETIETLQKRKRVILATKKESVLKRACNVGIITSCIELGRKTHDEGRHEESDALFQEGCALGAKKLCGYNSREVADVEKAAEKKRAADNARYHRICKNYPNGDFECKRVLKGSGLPQTPPVCRKCRLEWHRMCRKKNITGQFCADLVKSNCSRYCY